MSNSVKDRKNELVNLTVNNNPDFSVGKKFTLTMLIIWFASRIVFLIAELLCFSAGSITFPSMDILLCVIFGLFCMLIYSGSKLFLFLPLIGGISMITQTFTYKIYNLLSPEFLLVERFYGLAFLIVAYGQTLIVLLLLISKKSNCYFNEMTKINTQIINEEKLKQN